MGSGPTTVVGSDITNVVQALSPLRLLSVLGIQPPPADSLAFYAVLVAVGAAEIVEWPAVLLADGAQALVDRRLDEIGRSIGPRTA